MRYGRTHERTAVAAYASLMATFNTPVEIQETGLHIHPGCSFIAASPDRIVMKDNEGLLEVKCPSSKIGLTPMEACKDKKFCCEVVDGLTITFDKKFVDEVLLPGLIYFTKHTLFPEVVAGCVRRRRALIARGEYVSFKQYCKRFYVVEDGPGLKKKLRRLE
ncbi:hypothetical protein HPB47_021137 [Ixodes persulcatus]|uniref:Uncharacterized protein n=1 Tax=Ixodes persulcatus TaxID=34615 RepID=A0AC60QFT8_IXOPE|nr:hypothetical protein HPB47_021137 [Ixodes persulcatus]